MSDDNTASAPQEPRGAILPAVEPARGFSDADLLRRRTEALNRTQESRDKWQAEAERLRAENERLSSEVFAWRQVLDGSESAEGALRAVREVVAIAARAEDAEAKLRDVEALHVEPYPGAGWCGGCHDGAKNDTHPCATLAVLARSQAPQASAEQEACKPNCGWECEHEPVEHPVRPVTADDEAQP